MQPITEKRLKKFRNKIIHEQKVDDLELPRSIIESFSSVWNLWVKYPVLKSATESEEFHSVYVSMASYFKSNEDSDSCYSEANYIGVCDVCDEEICLKNNDVNFSMNLHEQSPHHLEAAKNFQEILESTKKMSFTNLKEQKQTNGISKVQFQSTESVQSTSNTCSSTSEVETHTRCSFIGEVADLNNTVYCSACKCRIPFTVFNISQHRNGVNHKLNVEASLKAQGIGEIDVQRNRRFCSACGCYVPATDFIVLQHVNGSKHKAKLKEKNENTSVLQSPKKIPLKTDGNEHYDFIGVKDSKNRRYCSICNCYVVAVKSVLEDHVKGANHRKNIMLKKIREINILLETESP